jgi:hypothetical protein
MISREQIPANSDVYIHSETHNLKKFAQVRYSLQKGDQVFLGCVFQRAPEYWN